MVTETTDPTLAPVSPFAGIEEAFAADLEPIRHDFALHGQPCWVVLRAMDGSAFSRYQSAGQVLQVDATKKTIETMNFAVNQDTTELELLAATIADFCLARKKTAKDGSGQVAFEQVLGTTMHLGMRKEIYRTLTPKLRQVLVQLCLEANGLAPLPA